MSFFLPAVAGPSRPRRPTPTRKSPRLQEKRKRKQSGEEEENKVKRQRLELEEGELTPDDDGEEVVRPLFILDTTGQPENLVDEEIVFVREVRNRQKQKSPKRKRKSEVISKEKRRRRSERYLIYCNKLHEYLNISPTSDSYRRKAGRRAGWWR